MWFPQKEMQFVEHIAKILHVVFSRLSTSFSGTKCLSILPYSLLLITIHVVCNSSTSKNLCFTLKIL